jgi:hypothetical protein
MRRGRARKKRGVGADAGLASRNPPGLGACSVQLFYSYPVELIAEWCSVSRRTAASWKCGVVKPSKQAVRLFELHRDGHVLAGVTWQEWRVNGGRLVDPEGNSTTQGQLRAYALALRYILERSRVDAQFAKIWPELQHTRELAGGSQPK